MKIATWFLAFLLASSALAQPRGGPQSTQAVIINNCVATSGACPADGYVCVLAATKVIYQCKVSSGWRQISIGGASNTPEAGECATWDAVNSTVTWADCGSGGGGGGAVTVQEEGTEITDDADTLNFAEGFDLEETSSGVVEITYDYSENKVDIASTDITGTLPITAGGTGQITAAAARSAMELAKSGANTDITSITGLSTMLSTAQGGTGLNTSLTADDSVLVMSAVVGTWATKVLPDCPAGNQLLYTASTNAFSCEADGASGTGTIKIVQEQGSSLGTDGSGTTLNFTGAAITASGTGAVKTIALAQSGSGAAVVDSDYAVTAGAGLSGGGALASTSITLTVASTEVAFLTDGGASTLTCGAAAGGKAQVMDNGTLEYCDGAATSVIRRAALADSSGRATDGDSADDFFATGSVDVGEGGTGVTSIGTSGQVLFNDSGVVGFDETTSMMSYNKTTDVLTVGSVETTGATDNNRYLEMQGNTGDVGIPSNGYIRLYGSGTSGSEVLKWYTFTGGIKTIATLTGTETFTNKTLTTPVVTGKVDRNNVTVDDDDCTGEQGIGWYDTTDSAFEFCNANSGTPASVGTGTGDITDVMGCSTGDCEDIVAGAADSLNMTLAQFLIIPIDNTLDTAGKITVDTTTTHDQLQVYMAGAIKAFSPVLSAGAVLENLASGDDAYEFFEAPENITVVGVSCRCRGTCSPTLATITIEDRGGNDMTITGTNPTCATTGNSTYAAVTANNTLVAGEGLAFNVTNTPDPATDTYTITVQYVVTPQ